MVNAGGRRFADEALPYNELGKIMNQQDRAGDHPNRLTWLIFDEGFRRRYTFPAARPGGGLPAWVTRVGSVANLAAAIAVDADTLADTIARWNRDCAVGCDTEFGRGSNAYERFMGDPGVGPNPNLGPIDQPPYYAVRVLSGTIGTKGGPVTDPAGRVLTAAGRPVGGLYAAGNAAAFWTGDGYPGPGATLGVAMTMGYLAGLHAAVYGRAVNRER
jgi:succinate dehydrogenase/fumarate reductase flavoprotein subunit